MPRGNHTGPMGMGSMTGRGAGYCAGYGMPGYANDTTGRGFGGGFGRGRGPGFFGRGWRSGPYYADRLQGMHLGGYGAPYAYPPPYQATDPEMERQALNNQAKALQSELDAIKKRLSEMETKTTEE